MGRESVKIKLAYGKKGLYVDLPDDLNVQIVTPEYVPGVGDQAEAVRDALRRPIGSKPLSESVTSSDTVAIVVNDITRPTPYNVVLPVLLDELSRVPDDQVTLFIATGTHRANTEAELRDMLGAEVLDRFHIIQNDARDRDSHSLVGTTRSGNDIWIHRRYVKCDVRILTGFIEPHFFAGFSGGGKACMPGLARLDTVLRNHGPQSIDHPMATWGVTHGRDPARREPNPIWEEIREAALMVQPSFLLNVALNRDKQITAVFAGDLDKAHEQGCSFVTKSAMVPAETTYDIVITSNSGYPLDLNLYQSVKGMSAASQVVKKGGSIIVAADCWDGIPQHGEYGKLLRGADRPQTLLDTVRLPGFQRQDTWQAQIQARICQKADVYFYSDNLSDGQIKSAWLKPTRSIEATVDQLLARYGRNASICVLPEGPQTIPYICEKSVT